MSSKEKGKERAAVDPNAEANDAEQTNRKEKGEGPKKTQVEDSNALDFYLKGVKSRIAWIEHIWNSRPKDSECDKLLEDLNRVFVTEASDVYKIGTFFRVQKSGSGGHLVCQVGSTQYFVENSFAFLESVSQIITIGSWLDLPSSLVGRLEKASQSFDIFELLNIYSALSQAVSDHKVKGLVWAVLTVGTVQLHRWIRTTKVPISEWPAKLRNCVAHAQGRIIGPTFVGYNYNPGSSDDEGSNSIGCNWQIAVERQFLINRLKKIFKSISSICRVQRYDQDGWKGHILLTKDSEALKVADQKDA